MKTAGAGRIPTKRQQYPTSCGWTAVAIVAEHYRADSTGMGPEERWAAEELSMWDIGELARSVGLDPVVGSVDVGNFTACPLPAIVLIDHGQDLDRNRLQRNRKGAEDHREPRG